MNKLDLKDIFEDPTPYFNKKITVDGWIRTIRAQKDFAFIELNDGTMFKNVQVVLEQDKANNYDELSKLPIATAVEVTGTLTESAGAKQAFEIKAEDIKILAASSSDYPLQKKRHTLEYLRTISHIRPRSNTLMAVFRVRSVLADAIKDFFRSENFVYVHTPILTASDAEGAGQMFQVTTLDLNDVPKEKSGAADYSKDFFGRRVGLTVSGQLEAEVMALAFKKVYTFGPTFRAENSNTPRHASEFWMVEPEMSFADLNDDMDTAERMIKYIINYCLKNAPQEMEFFSKFIDKGLMDRLNNVIGSDFERISYTKAVDILEKSGQKFEYPVKWGIDLQTEHERYITEQVYKKPVFVTDYPKDIKAFYMRQNDDGKTVAAADLLVPGVGEIIGGSQREERYDVLKSRILELGMDISKYEWYLDLRKYGGVKHSGYGLGFERMIMYMTGMQNIRDVLPFPRTKTGIDI